jgi:probable addiction module antidote protein
MKTKKSVAHQKGSLEDLKNLNFVIGYLNSILEELTTNKSHDPFLLALGRVAKAHRVQAVAEKSNLTRDAIYKALAHGGNPTFSTLHGILDTLGLQIQLKKKKRA